MLKNLREGVDHLAERSLPTPEVSGLSPITVKLLYRTLMHCSEETKLKKKRP